MELSGARVAVVTGANRGLGLETCRQLAGRGLRVVLTAREARAARDAAATLGVDHLRLDVTDDQSIERAAASVRERYGRVDVLVNNAGVSLRGFDEEVARATINVNVLGAIAVTDAFIPLLAERASIVMVSSGMGELRGLSPSLRGQFEDPGLSRARLIGLMRGFIRDVGAGHHAAKGWPSSAYRVSKIGLNAFTRVLARELEGAAVRVNAVCPGWVRTDMGGASATRSVEDGARGIVGVAISSDYGASGEFFRDGAVIPW